MDARGSGLLNVIRVHPNCVTPPRQGRSGDSTWRRSSPIDHRAIKGHSTEELWDQTPVARRLRC